MSTYMSLLKALQSGVIKSEDFIDYNPDEKRTIYLSKFGAADTDKLCNEFNLGWHPVLFKNYAVLLISDKATESKWRITGSHISFEWLEKYSKLYENKNLRSIGAVPTPELLKEIPDEFKKKDVWVYTHTRKSSFRFEPPRYAPSVTHHREYFSYHGHTYTTHTMQPIIFLPPNTVVEIDNQKDNVKTRKQGFKLYSSTSPEANSIHNDFQEPMWISLTEALTTGTLSQTDFVEYVPDKASVTFSIKETHAEKVQTAETEYDMGGWHPLIVRDGDNYHLYIFPTHCSKFKLNIPVENEKATRGYCTEVEGEYQYNHGVELLTKYARIYSNNELDVHGIPFTEELFDALDWSLITEHDSYWLADTFSNDFHWAAGYPLSAYELSEYYKQRLGLKWIAMSSMGYKQCESAVSNMSIRVAVPFPNDVMVEINNLEHDGSSKEKALKLHVMPTSPAKEQN